MIWLLYILIILISNIITGSFQPLDIYGFIIPCGTFLIGITFILRDFIQIKYGKTKIYILILISMICSFIYSIYHHDIFYITIASSIAFLVSETIDTEIFSRLKTSFTNKVLISGIIGGLFDSILFVIIGLSPLTSNILQWIDIINGIEGQFVIKSTMQFIGIMIIIIIKYFKDNYK